MGLYDYRFPFPSTEVLLTRGSKSTNAAPSIGPVLGGILAEKVGWRWIFWLLTILSGSYLAGIVLLFPETCRHLVHDGSIPAKGLNKTLLSSLRSRSKQRGEIGPQSFERSLHIPNPIKCLRILGKKNSLFVILVGSIFYTVFGCLGASLSAQCIELYSLNYLTGGLIYLPSGIGGIVAAYAVGNAPREQGFEMVADTLRRTSAGS